MVAYVGHVLAASSVAESKGISCRFDIIYCQAEKAKYEKILEDSFENAKTRPEMKISHWLDSKWGGKLFSYLLCLPSRMYVN